MQRQSLGPVEHWLFGLLGGQWICMSMQPAEIGQMTAMLFVVSF
jgi:hypothetical protein